MYCLCCLRGSGAILSVVIIIIIIKHMEILLVINDMHTIFSCIRISITITAITVYLLCLRVQFKRKIISYYYYFLLLLLLISFYY